MSSISPIELVNQLWKNRRKSNIVKWMMIHSGSSTEKLSKYLNCSKFTLGNKFNRNNFSFEDILIIAYACDCSFILVSNKNNDKRLINAEHFFSEKETWDRISDLKMQEENEQTDD